MRKFITFLFLFFAAVVLNAQVNTTRQLTKLYDGTIGSKTKYVSVIDTVFGGAVYDSLVVTVPYGECPLFSEGPNDSTAIRYGSHGISVEAINDSSNAGRPDSVYVVMVLNFLTPDGRNISSGEVLRKGWVQSANSTFNIDPANANFKTYMMRQEYFRATLTIKIYLGYPRTINKVKVYKYYRNNKG